MFEGLAEGLALGLATGTACLATCGPIYGAYLLSEERAGWQSLLIILKLSAGRFISYAIFGALAGLLGGSIPIPVRVLTANGGYLLFSVFLLLSVIRIRKSCGGCQTSRFLNLTRSPFLLGVLTGFSICPAFLIAMTVAFDTSGALAGSMLFTGFFFGTTVYILPFALFGLLTKQKWITSAARILAVAVAVYFAVTGIRGLVRYYTDPQRGMLVDSHSHTTDYVFSAMEQDTIYVLFFDGSEGDYGDSLAIDLAGDGFPELRVITTDSSRWSDAILEIPELSGVIAPWWVDERSGIERNLWQEGVAAALDLRRMRIFAIEYEPYCDERVATVRSWMDRYSFKCDPDSGFSFLMLNTIDCDPVDCSTCPITH